MQRDHLDLNEVPPGPTEHTATVGKYPHLLFGLQYRMVYLLILLEISYPTHCFESKIIDQ